MQYGPLPLPCFSINQRGQGTDALPVLRSARDLRTVHCVSEGGITGREQEAGEQVICFNVLLKLYSNS